MPPQPQSMNQMNQMNPVGLDQVEQVEFCEALKEIIFLERDLEAAKIDLALKSDFNLMDAFRLFDHRCFNAITAEDLCVGFQSCLGF